MTEYDLIDQIKREIKEKIADTKGYMAQGIYTDYASYRQAVGVVSSMEQMLSFVEESERKFLEQ